jgi:hypothetical protein
MVAIQMLLYVLPLKLGEILELIRSRPPGLYSTKKKEGFIAEKCTNGYWGTRCSGGDDGPALSPGQHLLYLTADHLLPFLSLFHYFL